MGAWGTTPFDSDDFGDTFLEVTEPIGEALFKRLQSLLAKRERNPEPQEAWTAIGMVIWAFHTGILRGHHLDLCLSAAEGLLDAITRDEWWMKSWRDPRAFRTTLNKIRAELEEASDGTPFLPGGLSEMFQSRSSGFGPPRRKR